jgi:ABC-2 type transport system ATP-binding protein
MRHLTRTAVCAEVSTVPADLTALSGVHQLVIEGTRVSASVDASGLQPFMTALTSAGLLSLTSAPPSLEDIFLRHYGRHDE